MSVKIRDIADYLNQLIPNELAYSWDNVGLLLGTMHQEVKKILLTLDVTSSIIDLAIEKKVDLIVSHHPFIFHPLKRINDPNIIKLIQNSISVYSAHTNLDLIKNGVNHALAEKLKLKNLRFIQKQQEKELFQLAVYIPESALDKLKTAIFDAGAGLIGEYSQCSNEYEVKGQFLPSSLANPSFGQLNHLEKLYEVKFECQVDSLHLKSVIKAIMDNHPYETPVYSIYKLNQNSLNYGLGLFGELESEMSLGDFAEKVKYNLQAPFVKLWLGNKKAETLVKDIAICGGSGSSILSLTRQADVFVTGDLGYHQYIDSKLPLIDAGHFYTENPVLQYLKKILSHFEIEIELINREEHDIKNLLII